MIAYSYFQVIFVKWYELLGHESEIRMIGFHMSIGWQEPALILPFVLWGSGFQGSGTGAGGNKEATVDQWQKFDATCLPYWSIVLRVSKIGVTFIQLPAAFQNGAENWTSCILRILVYR